MKYGWESSRGARIFFFVIIILANALFLVYWLYNMILELIAKFREEHENLFLRFCLCRNRSRLASQK